MEPDFWSDNAKAQEILRRKKFVDDRISAFAGLQKAMENLEFSMELWEMEPDGEVEAEISEQWDKFTKDVENFKIETLTANMTETMPYCQFMQAREERMHRIGRKCCIECTADMEKKRDTK